MAITSMARRLGLTQTYRCLNWKLIWTESELVKWVVTGTLE